jgi:hypothetical protein
MTIVKILRTSRTRTNKWYRKQQVRQPSHHMTFRVLEEIPEGSTSEINAAVRKAKGQFVFVKERLINRKGEMIIQVLGRKKKY